MVGGGRPRVSIAAVVASAVVVVGLPAIVSASAAPSVEVKPPAVVESTATVAKDASAPQFGSVAPAVDVAAPGSLPELHASSGEGFQLGRSSEKVADRTAVRQRFRNPDGSVTDRFSLEPRFYKAGTELLPIDTNLSADGSRTAKTVSAGGKGLAATANWFSTKLGNLSQGVTVGVGADALTMTPVGAVSLPDPTSLSNVAVYPEVWPGVDLRYRVTPTGLKEEMVLKNPSVASSYSFSLTGATTTGPVVAGKGDVAAQFDGSLGLSGSLGERVMFAPPVVTGDGDGRIFTDAKPTLTGSGSSVSVAVDPAWLAAQPASEFPIVVDPTITGRAGTGWASFAAGGGSVGDSYVGNSCVNPPTCSGYLWRSMANFSHGELYSNFVQSATLHMAAGAVGSPSGTLGLVGWASSADYDGAATYINGQSSVFGIGAGTSFADVDITETMRDMAELDPGNYGLLGFAFYQTSGYYSLHRLGFSTIDVTYESDGHVSNLSPASGSQTAHTRRPTLTATVGNAGGATTVNVRFQVACPGQSTIDSNWLAASPGTPYSWALPSDMPWNAECRWYAGGRNSSYEDWSPGYSITAVSQPAPAPALDRTMDGSIVSTPTLSLSAPGTLTDPESDTVYLDYSIATGSDGVTGRVVRSPLLALNTTFSAPTSSLPDGIYYATVRSVDSTGAASAWVKPIRFRVVQRLGVQAKMAYDSTGPFNVNLASGNLVVAASGPSFSTLGGDAGVNFTYNSQAAVPKGVRAAFWDDTNADGVLQSSGSPKDAKRAERIDPVASYNWNDTAGPIPGTVNPNSFIAEVTGSYKNTTGSAQNVSFQAVPVDSTGAGNKVKVQVKGGAAAGGPETSAWNTATTAVTVPANDTVSVRVEYAKLAAVASSGFRIVFSEGSGWADVPADRWMQYAPVLPGGWSSTGPGLGTLGYSRLSPGENQVTLYDDSGAAHVWRSNGDSFTPPPDEDGVLRRQPNGFTYTNAAGTSVTVSSGFEFVDDDGYQYLFDDTGQIVSVVAPADAVNPGALRYAYARLYTSGPMRMTQIKDPFGRTVDLTYKDPSTANCPTDGSSSQPPSYTLCLVTYTGFTRNSTGTAPTTNLYYDTAGNLAAVVNPGDTGTGVVRPRTDFAYDAAGRIVGVRDSYTNDLIASSVFTATNVPSSDPHWWTVTYGSGGTDGMVTQLTAPEPSSGGTRPQQTYTWNLTSTYPGAKSATRVAVAGSVNASGWTQHVDIDTAGRPVQSIDQGGVAIETFWDPDLDKQDRVVKTIDHHYLANPTTGLQTTTIYDAADRPTDTYGPGTPSEFIGQTSATAPHATTAYDEGIPGLAAKWFNNTSASGPAALYSTSSGTESWGSGAPSNAAFPGAAIGNDFSGTLTGQATFASPTALGVRADAGRLFVDDIKVGDTFNGAYRAAVTTDQPSNYWRLDDTTGSTTATDIASGVTGTYIGAPTLGSVGALNQGGSADPDTSITVGGTGVSGETARGVNVTAPSGTDALNLSGDMAIEAWVNPSTTTGYQMIVDRSTSTGTTAVYELRLNAGRLEWCQVNNGVITVVTAATALPVNAWSHVAATRISTPTGLVIKLYVNGVDVTPAGGPFNVATASLPTDTTRIGNRTDGWVFSGKLDDVAIYSHGLSAARVATHFAAATNATAAELSTANAWTQTIRDDGPSQWWRLGETTGTTAVDASSEGSSPGVYSSPTLGATGAIVGDPDTAVTFNGTSGGVTLPDDVISSRSLTIEMWFKATGAGALYGQRNATSTKYAPILYVGTDNKLYGGLWGPGYGAANLVSTGSVVGNGWHHVALTSNGVSQTLYLDGAQIGDRSGVPDVLGMPIGSIGSAWTNGWTATNNAWFVFNGTIDDVAVYSYPLSGSRVKTHYDALSLGEFSGTKRVRVDYQDLTGNAALQVVQGRPGSSTAVSAGVLSPRYGLVTSTVDPDGKKTSSEYTNPELGLKTADVADPAGLNLRTVYTYEGASAANQQFRRQLTRSLPGITGTATTPVTYGYWAQGSGATNTADNPCTTGTTETINQGGAAKTRTAVDPDGAASATAQTSETRYHGDGLIAATKRNAETGWTCFTYDGRGRTLTQTIPAFGSSPQRVVTTNYKADPDGAGAAPATAEWTSVTDDAASTVATSPILTKTDWLGRTISYTDALGRTTTTAYDQAGRVTTTTGPTGYGTVTQAYDSNGRPTTSSVNSQPIATTTYNTSSGVATSTTYPSGAGNAGNGVTVTNGFDTRGRATSVTWTGPESTAIASNTVSRSAAGRIVDEATDGTIGATGDANTTGPNYTYDGAARLTDAYAPGHHYTYNYGTPSGSDCPSTSPVYATLIANKNSNRTSVTDQPLPSGTATTTKSCYDAADRLTSTTAGSIGTNVTYDTRGRTTTLGTDSYAYDQTDRHSATTANASAARNALLAVGGPAALTSRDTWLQQRLIDAGWTVTIGDDDTVTASSASGKQLIVLSESVTQAGIGTKFTSVAVPLISAEPFLYDELGMTGTGTNQGGTSGATETQVAVTAAGVQSSLGAGLSAGNATIASSGVDLSWGKPAATATVAATIASDATKATLFGYRTGAAMVTGTAPAPRVGWTHYTGSPTPLNSTAVALFNAAIGWAAPASATTSVTYVRDVTDRIIARKVNGNLNACFSYTAGGDTPDQTLAPSGSSCSTTVTETVSGLPGGATLTSRGNSTTDVWSLSNIHGDTLAITNGNGVKQGTTLTYNPDGQALGDNPDNSTGAFDNGWLGRHQRPLERQGNLLQTIEMGARPYSVTTGRFLEIDPVEGGTANDYTYVTDPLNSFDLDGMCGVFGNPFKKCSKDQKGQRGFLGGVFSKGARGVRVIMTLPASQLGITWAKMHRGKCSWDGTHWMSVCTGMRGGYGRGGTTVGSVYMSGRTPDARMMRHESKHANQYAWFGGGAMFPVVYGIQEWTSGGGKHNTFERQAGLKDGCYVANRPFCR